ncbi:hypothetical protein KAE42_003564, partial [Acinetobacter baumannii]|nr:hypothetical protein [Acinetobacter baumannii]
KVQSEINLQMDVTKNFDANRQEAGITVDNIVKALEVTGQAIEGAKQTLAIAKQAQQEIQKLSPEDQVIFENFLTELAQSQRTDRTDTYYPLVLAAGEGLAMAAAACARSPACASATVNVLGAVGVAILNEQSDDKNKKTTPKPLPSTSGNSATGMPPNKDDNERDFKYDNKQIGKKLGKHVSDFGRNPANATDREYVLAQIENIARHPDKVVRGTFAGQGPMNTRGAVQFRIKGQDVVVTKPDGTFVTILRNGINNPSVKQALNGAK